MPSAGLFPAAAQRRNAGEADAEHSKSQRLRYGDGAKQSGSLAIEAIGEVERVGTSITAAGAKADLPKAAGGVAAGEYRDCAQECEGCRIVGIDLAFQE